MTDCVVVDASVAVKWIIREPDSAIAKALLNIWNDKSLDLIAPGLFAYEITNILYRRVVAGKISYDEMEKLLKKMFAIGIILDFSKHENISIRAAHFAHRFGLPAAYDAHYLAIAEREHCEYWTADMRLFNSVNGKLAWVHNLEEIGT